MTTENKTAVVIYPAEKLEDLKSKVEIDQTWGPQHLNKEENLDVVKTHKMNDVLKASLETEGYTIRYYEEHSRVAETNS
jgi:hypothetical protein